MEPQQRVRIEYAGRTEHEMRAEYRFHVEHRVLTYWEEAYIL